MEWAEYCLKKKIDKDLFLNAEPELYQELVYIFEQVHPNSFTEQKKFLINDLRRKYLLKNIKPEEKEIKLTVKSPVKIPGINKPED